MEIRLIIADDHHILRSGIKGLLSSDPAIHVVGEAENGDEAVELASILRPDMILLDIHMPETDGLQALRKIKVVSPETRVLILTMHEDRELLQECLLAGASGYIVKRAGESELIDAIYAAYRGIIYIHPSLMKSLISQPAAAAPNLLREDEELTQREIEVLVLIAEGHTNRQIASRLNISVRTVETHRSNLMDKLNLHSRVDLIRYAVKKNLVSMDQND